jgi:trk system potassium uptake protein TrkA
VYPEKQLAKWAAIRFTSDHILDYISLDDEHAIFEVDPPPSWDGKTVGQIDIRKKYGINILGIKRGGKLQLTVTPDTCFMDTDTILVLGDYKSLRKCFHI